MNLVTPYYRILIINFTVKAERVKKETRTQQWDAQVVHEVAFCPDSGHISDSFIILNGGIVFTKFAVCVI